MTTASVQGPLVANIVLDSPLPRLDHTFDYAVPERLLSEIALGQKVSVPLKTGNRRAEGWVIGLSSSTDFSGLLTPIEAIISPVCALTPELYALARKVADRQAGSAVDVLRLAIPQRYVRAEKDYLASISNGAQKPHRSDVVSIQRPDESVPPINLGQRLSLTVQGGVCCIAPDVWVPRWISVFVAYAFDQISAHKSCILAVPDFRDIELLQTALSSVGLGKFVTRTDSALPGAERWKNYLRILNEEVVIVLGNRSCIYAPVRNIGLIAIWDSADESYTEPLSPYAHPRDVALIRQSDSGCSLVFASHIPAVDSVRLVKLDYLEAVSCGSAHTQIIATDIHSQKTDDQRSARIPPAALVAARKAITMGPVLVQTARPGYAGAVRCSSCHEKALCDGCSGPLALRSKGSAPSCRWCGKLQPSWSCSHCHSTTLRPTQAGTEKTAEDLAKAFPGIRVVFSDAEKKLKPIEQGPILVIATPGTEPMAHGGYQAVLVLDGESSRSREDLDTDLSALRSWMNAASLAAPEAPIFIAGTGEKLGHVIEDSLVTEFVNQTLLERESLGLPPATRVAVVTGSRDAISAVESKLAEIPHRSVLGPVPLGDESYRLIMTFDYRDGTTVAKSLRALILKTAITSRKPAGASAPRSRVLRLNVRIDDSALRGTG